MDIPRTLGSPCVSKVESEFTPDNWTISGDSIIQAGRSADRVFTNPLSLCARRFGLVRR